MTGMYTDICGKVEGGTVQDELGKRAMVWSTK